MNKEQDESKVLNNGSSPGWPSSASVADYLKLPVKEPSDIDTLFSFVRESMDALTQKADARSNTSCANC